MVKREGIQLLDLCFYIANVKFMHIKGALDSGAHGIIVPLLYTADDAIKLVKSAKFPPQGQRGFGSPFPMEKFGGQTTSEYLQQANESLLTIVQIETKEALQNVCASGDRDGCGRETGVEMFCTG